MRLTQVLNTICSYNIVKLGVLSTLNNYNFDNCIYIHSDSYTFYECEWPKHPVDRIYINTATTSGSHQANYAASSIIIMTDEIFWEITILEPNIWSVHQHKVHRCMFGHYCTQIMVIKSNFSFKMRNKVQWIELNVYYYLCLNIDMFRSM